MRDELRWAAAGPGRWMADVDYARIAVIQRVDGGHRAAVVLRKDPERIEGHYGVHATVEAARDALEARLRCCAFCGSRWRCQGGREPSAELRDRRVVGERVVYSVECETLERARQAAQPDEPVIEVQEIDGVRWVDPATWAAEGRDDVAALEARVRERLGGGDVAVTTDLRSWSATWRRRYPSAGLSDRSMVDGATYAEVLAAILRCEDEADAEDAARVAAVHGDSASATITRR